jgi:DNA replication protein DnaC
MTTTTETRTCSDCQKPYVHEPSVLFDTDIFADHTQCNDCTEIQEAAMEKERSRERWEAEARERWESTVEEEYRETSVDHPDFPKPLLSECLRWMRGETVMGSDNKLFLGLIGQSGRCKTRVASVVVKRLIWKRERVTWVNSAKFQWCCQNQFSDSYGREAQQQLRSYSKANVLVFDDIGSLKSTETVSDNLYSLLEYRTANRLRMIWTSNETLDEILAGKGVSEKARVRNISRLGGFSNIMEV